MTGKSPASEARQKRQAEALRENLKRRKAQARGRSRAAESTGKTGLPPQSDGD